MKWILFLLSTFIFCQNYSLKDSIVLNQSTEINSIFLDKSNSIYFTNENNTKLSKIESKTDKIKHSAFYSSISDLNLTNSLFVNFFNKNFNRVHFLDENLFETQSYFTFYSNIDAVFVKNNFELIAYQQETNQLKFIDYRRNPYQIIKKIELEKTFDSYEVNYFLNELFFIQQLKNDFIITSVLNFTTKSLVLNELNFKTIILNQNILYYSANDGIYSINLNDLNTKEKLLSIKKISNFSINSKEIIVHKNNVIYIYELKN